MATPVEISESVLADLRRELGDVLVGFLLTGSHARGDPDPRSDLDLIGLVAEPWRQRRVFRREDVLVELFLNPPGRLREELCGDQGSATIFMLAESEPLFDPAGEGARLKEEAAAVLEAGPPEPSAEDKSEIRFRVGDALRDLEDVEPGRLPEFEHLLGPVLEKIIAARYRAQGLWMPAPKHLLRDLKRRNDPALTRVERVLNPNHSHRSKVVELRALAEEALAGWGGMLTEWCSRKEPV